MRQNIPETIQHDLVSFDTDSNYILGAGTPALNNHAITLAYGTSGQGNAATDAAFNNAVPAQAWRGYSPFDWSDGDSQEVKITCNDIPDMPDNRAMLIGCPYDTETEITGESLIYRMSLASQIKTSDADNSSIIPVLLADRKPQTDSDRSQNLFRFIHHKMVGTNVFRPKYTALPIKELSIESITSAWVNYGIQSSGRIYLQQPGKYYLGFLFLVYGSEGMDCQAAIISISTTRMNKPWNIRPSTGKG